jgi:hypothetical protein
MPVVTQRQLVGRIRSQVAELEENLYSNAGDAFCHWAMKTYFELDEDEALEACNISGPGDRGVDAFWPDESQRRVVAAQAKYSSRSRTFDAQSVVQLASAYAWLVRLGEEDSSTAKEELRSAAQHLRQLREVDSSYPVELYCFASGTFSDEAVEHADAFNADHADEDVSIKLVGLKELADALEDQRSRLDEAPEQEIPIRLRDYFVFDPPDEPKTVVASVNVKELADIERQYRYRIFQQNVRYFLRGKNRVNSGMASTLSTPEGRQRFWYYNNGIAIVCDSVDIEDDEDASNGNGAGVAKVSNLQIVNGCQTTTTLGEMADELADEDSAAYVLVRIIEANDPELRGDISLYNNRQSSVKDRDLLSNDAIQERLEYEFRQMDPPWFYERKRGQWDAQVKPNAARRRLFGDRKIDNEVAAQAAYAFWHDPGVARARKRMLFVRQGDNTDEGLYDDLFNQSTTPEWLLLPFRIQRFVAARKRQFLRLYKEASEADSPTTAQSRALSRGWMKFADQFILGAIHFYLDQVVEIRRVGVQRGLLDDDVFDDVVAKAYDLAVRDLSPFFRSKRQQSEDRDEPFDPANYVKGNWKDVKAWLEDQWEFRADEEPFEGVDLPTS